MREKLSISEFEQIKKQLNDIYNKYMEEYEQKKDLLDFDENEFNQNFFDEYLQLQEKLLSYDLSEIPFDAWENLEILSDDSHIADFSNTHANIDLNKIRIYSFANLKGCNLRNFDEYDGDYHTLEVDEEVKKEVGIDLISLASSELQEKFYSRTLEIDDVIDNIELFENIRIANFLKNGNYKDLAKTLGDKNLIEVIKKHPNFIKNIDSLGNIYTFINIIKSINNPNLEERIKAAVKRYCLERVPREVLENNPQFLASFNFKIIPEATIDDLMKYDEDVFVLDEKINSIIEIFGINNIKKMEQDTKIFSTYSLDLFYDFFNYQGIDEDIFKDDNLSYSDFQDDFAKLLNEMRKKGFFVNYPSYDFITGSFRDNHKGIFIDMNAPQELKNAFYKNEIDCEFLNKHREYIPFLIDYDIEHILKYPIYYNRFLSSDYNPKENLASLYANKFGNKECLEFLAKYGYILELFNLNLDASSLNDKELLEKKVRESIFLFIKSSVINYSYLEDVLEFKTEHPELFVDFTLLTNISEEEREKIKNEYYSRELPFSLVQKYPELIDLLKDKDLSIPFVNYIRSKYTNNLIILGYILNNCLTNQDFLALCYEYGDYLTDNLWKLIETYKEDVTKRLTLEEIKPQLEIIIARECSLGNFRYFEDAPRFLKEKYPELFLDFDAPETLKQYFYNMGDNYRLTFDKLSKEKGWLPYLKGKSVSTALLRSCPKNQKAEMLKYFQLFGEFVALKLGIRKSETVEEMIKSGKVDLMKEWYDKTGHKFIPDYVVMQIFPIEEADKFLISGSWWSNLMRIGNYKSTPEGKEGLLKLAYSFGVFDQDKRGYQKLEELLTGIPRKLNLSSSATEELTQKFYDLKEVLKSENIPFLENFSLFDQIYKKELDGTRTLTINPQNHPKTVQMIRNMLATVGIKFVSSYNDIYQLFGGFDLKYDPDFREFFLKNLDVFLENPEYTKMLTSIQKQFKGIKAFNSNRTLTLELAISYVNSNKYQNINPGNERLAEVSSIAGYSEEDFLVLQQIYNYGKQRAFGSIPRIENQTEEYTYEILRLDDPLAIAIGTLTDCCQEIGNAAETCMEHAMTSTDGRIFVIKDKEGNIIAQSWVWRNKDTLCFDNIEIPNKAFLRANRAQKTNEEFTKEIYDIYKKAASELIAVDEKVYKSLLASGKITREQYEGLRLRKITVGLGYNDIASTLKKEAKKATGTLALPPDYTLPVHLGRSLYTSDSREQYILEERDDGTDYEGENIMPHHDTYVEYTDSNFNVKHLLTLEKLEIKTKGYGSYLKTNINLENANNLVTKLAINYNLNPKTTKIILHPNFAIIYDINDNTLKIGDLLFNTKLENNQDIEANVIIQINLALNQICKNFQIDISDLDDNQKDIYEKAQNLNKENNQERGVRSAR